MRFVEVWLKDILRKKDLGFFLEKRVRRVFFKVEVLNVNEKECCEMYEVFERILNDNVLKKYLLEESYWKIIVSGLDYEGCYFMNFVKREEEFNKKFFIKLINVILLFLRRGYVVKKFLWRYSILKDYNCVCFLIIDLIKIVYFLIDELVWKLNCYVIFIFFYEVYI